MAGHRESGEHHARTDRPPERGAVARELLERAARPREQTSAESAGDGDEQHAEDEDAVDTGRRRQHDQPVRADEPGAHQERARGGDGAGDEPARVDVAAKRISIP